MKRGFTLVEVLIVIGLAVLLLTAGMINLYGFRSGQTVDSEARELVATLKAAQEKSVSQDSNSRWGVYLKATATPVSYSLYRVDETKKATADYEGVPGDIVDSRTLETSIALEIMDSSVTSTIIFLKGTSRPEATASIKITNSSNPETIKTVTVSAQGRIDFE